MLSISPPMKGAGQGNYYLELAREDYYLEGGEPPGCWLGRGAEAFRLTGEVEREALQNLLAGFSPNRGRALVQNAGQDGRQSGWDLTFSAPKTVSVLWSQLPESERREIQAAQDRAVAAAIRYLEDVAGVTRRGETGAQVEKAKLVAAAFEHGTSRAQDPQLHTHVVLLNIGVREDGTTGTIRSRDIFQHKMAAGALYRLELANELGKRLGVRVERVKSWFEVKGVNKTLVEAFSKRRQEVEEALAQRGASGAVAAKIAALDTRGKKEHRPRAELLAEWLGIGAGLGWLVSEALALVRRGRMMPHGTPGLVVDEAVEMITKGRSYFSERDLVRNAAEVGQDKGLGVAEILAAVREKLASTDIVRLVGAQGERVYTTRAILALERNLLRLADEARKDDRHSIRVDRVRRQIEKRPELSAQQKAAIEHITAGQGAVSLVAGMAGTGKSTLLGIAREIWEAEGFQVCGAALSGKAAQGLEDGSKIKSRTIALTLMQLGDDWEPMRLSREAIRRGAKDESLRLTSKTILVVDEAGMVDTRQLHELMERVRNAGAKLVLVGDAKQLQPIEAGGPFRSLIQRLGAAELTEIKRQREDWAREAVKAMSRGEAEAVLRELAARDRLRVEGSRSEAKARLIREWADEGVRDPRANLILGNANEEVRELNRLAQDERIKAGMLGEQSVRVQGDRFHPGDRVLFTKNSRLYGVMNGSLGTVERVSWRKLGVVLDTGTKVTIPIGSYDQIRLGYAATTHKAQGMTAENVFILAGDGMQDRELSYVQVSRAREKTVLYTDTLSAGGDLADIAQRMSTSRAKRLAVDLPEEREERERNPQFSGARMPRSL